MSSPEKKKGEERAPVQVNMGERGEMGGGGREAEEKEVMYTHRWLLHSPLLSLSRLATGDDK